MARAGELSLNVFMTATSVTGSTVFIVTTARLMVFGNEYNQIGMEMFFINTDVQLFLSVSSCVTTYSLLKNN